MMTCIFITGCSTDLGAGKKATSTATTTKEVVKNKGIPKTKPVTKKKVDKYKEMIDKELENITDIKGLKDKQKEYKKGGRYKHIPKTTIGGEEISVTEYETAKGEVGYQIIYYKDGVAYKSEGFGVEAESRTYEKTIK